jgi:cbb3-type cytochrome oxidase subunit 3
MTILWSAMFAIFFGFVFGVGCSLAVMYSIYNGGYRAAVKESQMPDPPERYRKALADLKR